MTSSPYHKDWQFNKIASPIKLLNPIYAIQAGYSVRASWLFIVYVNFQVYHT